MVSILSFLFIWQMAVQSGIISQKLLPTPSKVFALLFEKFTSPNPDGAVIQVNIMVSLSVALTGLLSAIVIGAPLGLLMGWYKSVDRFVRPLFEIVRPIPPIAWIPLTILWVGVGLEAKAMIIFFSAFVPCVINSYTGVKGTNQTLINVAKTFGASNFVTFVKVGVPSAMPMVFAGIRIALGNAWGTLVAAELLAANAGLGYMIAMGRQFARPDVIVLGMVTIGVLGFGFTYIFTKIENIVVRWRTM
ncbi:ABC transporter permease [Petroclostridium sp. X23]|uniref:ABC transporter permease n=1 Tax=Petroclostridium sp. X23 TaxID=3045146 RepID=UPI0024AC8309|nr:ABC transporter permease [Petroclostridium sp. X23]WHH61696.1 ABC transporter permease [Petroclostridium sp. X23]